MIYDCFTFFNELELLEIRLHELDGVVDKFVIVEATRTFTKKKKKLYFEENKARFKDFEHKIIHIIVDKYPTFFKKFRPVKTWDYEHHQREAILQGLKDCKPEDWVIISDIDEIPKAEQLKNASQTKGIKVFEQDLFYYFFNCICTHFPTESTQNAPPKTKGHWRGSVMLPFREIQSIRETRMIRDKKESSDIQTIENGGWHFSFLGGLAQVITKLQSYSHATEAKYSLSAFKDNQEIEEIINSGLDLFGRGIQYKFIPLDEQFPEYLLENQEKYQHLIKPITQT